MSEFRESGGEGAWGNLNNFCSEIVPKNKYGYEKQIKIHSTLKGITQAI